MQAFHRASASLLMVECMPLGPEERHCGFTHVLKPDIVWQGNFPQILQYWGQKHRDDKGCANALNWKVEGMVKLNLMKSSWG